MMPCPVFWILFHIYALFSYLHSPTGKEDDPSMYFYPHQHDLHKTEKQVKSDSNISILVKQTLFFKTCILKSVDNNNIHDPKQNKNLHFTGHEKNYV